MKTAVASRHHLAPSGELGARSAGRHRRVRLVSFRLAEADHRAIARYVVELLRDAARDPSVGRHGEPTLHTLTVTPQTRSVEHAQPCVPPIPDGATYVKAEQLMQRYQVSAKFICKYAIDLGATRLSPTGNSKLRYHLPTADAFIASRRKQPMPSRSRGPGRKPAPRTHTPSGAPLAEFV